MNRIGGVMVIWLASRAGDRGFKPRLGQTKLLNWYFLLLQ